MNTFKKKSLHAAVLAGLGALGVAGTANAVHINPEGLGQVLLYPYYTVRNNNVTAMSIVNTTSLTKLVKVRFLEGKNSREVLDFNLFLSPQDIWTGVIIPTATGARVETGDNSCVTPSDLFGNAAGAVRTVGSYQLNDFKNFTYTSPADSAVYTTNDRTREGYIEVLEMGIITVAATAAFAKHSAGVPNNCAALDAFDSTLGAPANVFSNTVGATTNVLAAPGGGLAGRATLFNGANGTNYAYDVTAIDAWAATPQYSAAGSLAPSLTAGTGLSTNSLVFVTSTPTTTAAPAGPFSAGVVSSTWATSADAMSAIFMRNTVINEFITDAGTISKTDWVITMPTKRGTLLALAVAPNPFSNIFDASAAGTGACDAYTFNAWNREEGTITAAPGTILPSPTPPAVAAVGQNLCWEANVVEFGTTGLLGSNNNIRLLNGFDVFTGTTATTTGAAFATLSRRTLQGPNGWAFLGFGATALPAQVKQVLTPATSSLNGAAADVPVRSTYGLPVIGVAFHNYTNSGVASAYGGVVAHKYTRDIR
jgi:hypothetical protein